MTRSAAPFHGRARIALFAVVLAISLVMAFRSQVGRDQFQFLILGWEFYAEGRPLPHGGDMSGGGLSPGYLLGLLSGLPLFLWQDYRAPNLLILLSHVLAYLLLDRALRDSLGSRGRLLFALFYWMGPWRVYFSAHLWNPNWLFLPSAVHVWTAMRQRQSASWLHSFLHVLAIGVAFQLHASFLILPVVSALLWLRGYLKIHWPGALLAALLTALSVVPWAMELLAQPDMRPLGGGFLGRGLVVLYPVLRGVLYWLRYPSLLLAGRMVQFDFTPELGAGADGLLTPIITSLARVIGALTLLVALAANVWLWRQTGVPRFAKIRPDVSSRAWLVGCVRWTFVGAVLTFCLSPTTIMMWQGFIVMAVAMLPVVLWLDELMERSAGRWLRAGLVAYAAFSLLLLAAQSVAAPMYRQGGRRMVGLRVKEMYPVLSRLGVDRKASVVVDPEKGWTTDLLDMSRDWQRARENR